MTDDLRTQLATALGWPKNNPILDKLLSLLSDWQARDITVDEAKSQLEHDAKLMSMQSLISFEGAQVTGDLTIGDVAGNNVIKLQGIFVTLPQPRRSRQMQVDKVGRPENYIPFERNSLFQSRPGEFEELERLLFEPGPRPKRLGLVGMGGVGKTQLAVELAHRFLDENRYPDGIFWLNATGTLADWQHALAELAFRTNYLPPDDKSSDPDNELRRAQYFCRYLAKHPGALLVLDNVEDPSLVMSVLPTFAGEMVDSSLLYTSRVPRVPAGITTYSVDKLPEEAALRLLLFSTRPALLDEVLAGRQSDEAKAANELCNEVGYLPLALVHLRAVMALDQEMTLAHLLADLRERGILEVANDPFDPHTISLVTCFQLSWEKVRDADARRLLKLAAFYPEAAPIPLWLLGMAAGLGEQGEVYLPLGKAYRQLQQLSLLEKLVGEQVELHPLVRAFVQKLTEEEDNDGNIFLEEAIERLATEFADLNKLERRALQVGYWYCLEQLRIVQEYAELLKPNKDRRLRHMRRWLELESHLLGDSRLWPNTIPALFYQQIYNRAVEESQPIVGKQEPALWLRQLAPVGAETRALLKVYPGHLQSVTSVAFSPDGMKVLTGSVDQTARLWETNSGKLLMTLTGHVGWVLSVAFSSDGTKVLTGSADQTAQLWNIATGKPLMTYRGHLDRVQSVAFSPDGTKVLTGSSDLTAGIWKATSGQLLIKLKGHKDRVQSVAFSPDGTKVLTGSSDLTARIWEVASGKLLATLKSHKDRVQSVAFSPDGTKVLTGSWDRTARLWEAASGKLLTIFEGHRAWVRSVAFSPDGTKVLTGSADQTASLWEVASGKVLTIFEGHADDVESVAFSPDGTKVLTGSADQTARLWNAESEESRAIFEGHTSWVRSVAFSPDGTKFLTASADQTARLWEAAGGGQLMIFEGHADDVESVAFSPDGTKVLTGSADQTARLWVVASGLLLIILKGHKDRVQSVAFSPDGTKVLTGSADQTARLWEAASGKLLTIFEGHRAWVRSVAFSPDGTKVLTGSDDQTARLWEAMTGQPLMLFEDHKSGVWSVAFSPDGTKVLTGSDDQTARLWEAASGQLISTLNSNGSSVTRVSFSSDSQLIMTCDRYGRIGFWQNDRTSINSLLAAYATLYEIGGLHWQNRNYIVLADLGGPRFRPNLYHLQLEGIGWPNSDSNM